MKRKIGLFTAISIVIANMIGTGVFTSVGFQLQAVQNTWSILILWIAGGILSLFGAFAYAELGTYFKQSGGDYIYLSRVFHPLLGYLSAWAGLIVGFSAPVALAAMAFTKYMSPFGIENNSWVAIILIIIIGLMHSFTIKHSSRFQNITTVIKVLFIVALIIIGYVMHQQVDNAIDFSNAWPADLIKPGFAVSMVYVSFAYTGWNAAAYVADEIDRPKKNLPAALIASTLFVAVVYTLFQYVLLKHAGVAQLQGREDVTSIAFTNFLGQAGGKWVSVFIAIQLLATISAYLWVGSRVTSALAKDFKLWRYFSTENSHGVPVKAVWLHVIISIALALSGSFEQLLLYAGFVLQLMASLTVATSLFLRYKQADVFKTPFKPWLQVIFLTFNVWVLVFTFINRPVESMIGLAMLMAGGIIYRFDNLREIK